MPAPVTIRTSLEVGYAEGELPEEFVRYRGMATRAIAAMPAFPFEDEQFDVVMMAGSAVSRTSVREANRVLRPNGRLFFKVQEKTGRQEGYSIPDIYAVVREGFNIVEIERPSWWLFGRKGRTISICASKKNWKDYRGFARSGSLPLSPFRNGRR